MSRSSTPTEHRRLAVVAVSALLAVPVAAAAPSRAELDERLVQLERIVENQGLQRLELARQMESLQEELRALRGQLEELQFALEGARGQQRQQYLDLDGRLQAVEERATRLAEATQAPGQDPDDQYQEAFELLKGGQYAEARAAFEAFLKQHPGHELAANAQYWVGEVHYVEKDFEAALWAFGRVAEVYPQARKTPDALLKSGYCEYELGRFADARTTLRRLVSEFPGSPAAREASERLERMDAEGR